MLISDDHKMGRILNHIRYRPQTYPETDGYMYQRWLAVVICTFSYASVDPLLGLWGAPIGRTAFEASGLPFLN